MSDDSKSSKDTEDQKPDGNKTQKGTGGLGQKSVTDKPKRSRAAQSPYAQ